MRPEDAELLKHMVDTNNSEHDRRHLREHEVQGLWPVTWTSFAEIAESERLIDMVKQHISTDTNIGSESDGF